MANRRKGASGSHTITCPQCDKEIDCAYEITPYYPATGEYMYSLGTPEEPSEVEWQDAPEMCPECGQDLKQTLSDAEARVFEANED